MKAATLAVILVGETPVLQEPTSVTEEMRDGELVFRDGRLVELRTDGGWFSMWNDTLSTTQVRPYFYVTDYLGSVRMVCDGITGEVRQSLEYLPSGYVFRSDNYAEQPYMFCGKELVKMHGWNMYDSNARFQHKDLPRFTSMDPLAEKYYSLSPYNYAGNDPVNAADPSGESPVYNIYGKFLGTTKEGFTGTIIILKGTGYVDVSNLSSFFLLNTFGMLFTTLDGARDSHLMTDRSLKNVYNNVIKYFDGISLFGRTFSYRSISGGIKYDPKEENAAWYTLTKTNEIYFGPIPNSYEYTVENIASSVIVHEWYSHMISKSANTPNPHSNAYFNVMLYKPLWNKTTDRYKAFVNSKYWEYICTEMGINLFGKRL